VLIEPLLSQVVFTVESGLLLLAVAILLGPALAERLRIPGLVGLIFIGMVFGPFVLNWMVAGGLVATVGAAGLLYLMFLAGIELDLATFADNRRAAVTFGLLTFAIPFTISFVVGIQYLDMSLIGAALVGAMWASHTIVAYPEVKTAGLDTNRAVGSAVASTVITDVLALIILAVAASSTSLQAEPTTRAGGHEDALLPLPLANQAGVGVEHRARDAIVRHGLIPSR
jgi:Kef-type K+ transport system membrane component KefB